MFLSGRVNGNLDYYRNSFISFAMRGVHTQMNVVWDFEGPSSNDTFLSQFRGTKSRFEVRQGAVENFRTEIYVIPNIEAARERGAGRFADEDWLA